MNPTAPAAATPMTPQWQAWIAENLLRGVTAPQLLETLRANGIDPAAGQAEIEAAAGHPYLVAAAGLVPRPGASQPVTSDRDAARADKFAWYLELRRRAARLAPGHGTVPRIQNPTAQELLDGFYSQHRPCVIEGAMTDWPALTRWTPEHLKADGRADGMVAVEVFRDEESSRQLIPQRKAHEMRFGDVVDAVEGGATDGLYMTASGTAANEHVMQGLWGDIRYPEYLAPDHSLGKGLFWYGPAGTVTPIHHDLTNNLMAQVRGRKHVKLVAPYESADLPTADFDRYAQIDLEHPDLDAHPDFARVTVLDVELGPGDMLLLPAGWWHSVRSLDASITLTFMNFVYDTDFHTPNPRLGAR